MCGPEQGGKRMTFEELIERAQRDQCSDVHITVGTALAVRRFGVLHVLENEVPTAEESRNMIYETLTEAEIKKVEAGEDLDFAVFTRNGTRLRANVYHQRNNIAATYRLLDTSIPDFESLLLPEAARNIIHETKGLVLITGPTRSGKTTTLASMIDQINKTQAKHVITIEDPIEYVYYHKKSMIHQREIGRDVSDFASALRSSLREDPDIIMVGEMRDYETITAAITAAETGHLVFSSLHTNGASATIERILDAYPPEGQELARNQLSNVLKGVFTQKLLPRADKDGLIMATEIMLNNQAVATQIRDNKLQQLVSSMQSGLKAGMHTMTWDLRRLMAEGKITRETALRYCDNVKELDSGY